MDLCRFVDSTKTKPNVLQNQLSDELIIKLTFLSKNKFYDRKESSLTKYCYIRSKQASI